MKPRLCFLAILIVLQSPQLFAASAAEQLLEKWQANAQQAFSAERGEQAWNREHQAGDGKSRACTNCHHSDLTKAGEHIKTKKLIAAMAPSVNPERYTDVKKINKWFLRNCKWTLGRKCTAQEKGDFLAYLLAQ